MKIFSLSKEEVEQIKKRQITFLVLGVVIGILAIALFLIFATRKTFILFLSLSLFITLCVSIFFLYMLLGKLKSTNNYLFILRKSENSKESDSYFYLEKEESIQIKNGNSYRKYFFIKDDNKYAFYVLFDQDLELEQGKKYKLTYLDNILLEWENDNEKD